MKRNRLKYLSVLWVQFWSMFAYEVPKRQTSQHWVAFEVSETVSMLSTKTAQPQGTGAHHPQAWRQLGHPLLSPWSKPSHLQHSDKTDFSKPHANRSQAVSQQVLSQHTKWKHNAGMTLGVSYRKTWVIPMLYCLGSGLEPMWTTWTLWQQDCGLLKQHSWSAMLTMQHVNAKKARNTWHKP